MDRKSFLKRVLFLKDLPADDLSYLVKIAHEHSYKKGDEIFSADTSGDSLFIVISGRVKIYTCSNIGKIKILAYLEKGDFFGEMALLEEQSRSASAKALEDSNVMSIRRRDFQKLLKTNSGLALNFLKVLCNRLRQADKEIESLTFQNVFGRVALIILKMADRYGQVEPAGLKINIDLTHQDLSQLAGTAREMVTRILNRLKRIGCINYNEQDRRVTITELDKLKELIYN
ncbi:MAG: Crp/Fnr family transcriptional regulator [bacterium]